VVASVRPERIEALFSAPADPGNVLEASVSDVIYFGDHLRLRCTVAGQAQATVKLPLATTAQPVAGQGVWLRFPAATLRIYA
jgi:putative spermidine/putrescine transport system ATP-binding protein